MTIARRLIISIVGFSIPLTLLSSSLGLSMTYGFIEQSGGHVSNYSEENVGTSVTMYLPPSKVWQAEKVWQWKT